VQKPKVEIDPPEGWKYGFPKEWDWETPWDIMLRLAGYPEKDIPFALKYMRVITHEDSAPGH
jgi:hypothetical protein